MPEKEYLLGNRAKDLLIYTTQVTKPVADNRVEAREIVAVLKRAMESKNPSESIQQTIAALNSRKSKRRGFPKSTTFTYVKDLRECAIAIVKNVHAANECMFNTEYELRLKLIKKVLEDCNLMLKLVEISLELGYIDAGQCKHWTERITNVKYMCASWKKKDTERAKELIKAQEVDRLSREKEMLLAIVKEVLARK